MTQDTTSTAVETAAPRAVAARTGPAIRPAVDIFEDGNGITLLADLPGVAREQLSIGVDGRRLTIEAPFALGSDGHSPVYTEVRADRYRRSFDLSGDLDTAGIEAGLRDGVLTLRVPKLERAKPRRIDVRVG